MVTSPYIIVDVGARWGVSERWRSLQPDLCIFGFDPDVAECDHLNAALADAGDSTTTYVPVALGRSNGAVALHLTAEPACSSLYPPISRLAESIPELVCTTRTGEQTVDLVTLDDWCASAGVGYIDAMKLDTQGSELGVLEGAERMLRTVQLIEVEVEFNPIYEGQPLFGDIDAFLRRHGFMLWRLDHLVHYSAGNEVGRVPLEGTAYFDSKPIRQPMLGGQLYWGHAYYTRAELCPASSERPSQERAGRASAVARAIGLDDLALSAALACTTPVSPP